MSGAFESTLLSPPLSTNKLFMETGFGVNAGFERYRNSEQVISDGATSNRAQIQGPFDATNNPRGWVAGAASLTWRYLITVPASVPSADTFIAHFSSSSSATPLNTPGSLMLYFSTSGETMLRAVGATNSDLRRFISSTFRSTYAGQTGVIECYMVNGTTDPVIYWNGVNITSSSSWAVNITGTPPDWLYSSLASTYHLTGYNWPSGPAPVGCWILGSLTDADRAFHRSTGKYPAWVVAGGSAENMITSVSRNSDFSAGATDWSGFAGGTATVNAGALDVTTSGSTTGAGLGVSFLSRSIPARVQLLVTATISNFSASGGSTLGIRFSGAPGNAILASGNGTVSAIIEPQTAGAVTIVLVREGGTGLSFTIDNISIVQLGALSLPGIQPCAVVDDLTTIGGNSALLVGMNTRSSSNKKVWRISDLTKTSGNEQLLGGPVFYGTSEDLITKWTIVNAGGTTTVSLGNVSGGTQYANAVSCPTGTTVITLLTAVPLTTNLWCNANTTASLTHIIEGKRTV